MIELIFQEAFSQVIGIDVADHHVRDLIDIQKRVLTQTVTSVPVNWLPGGRPREPLIPFNPTEDEPF